MHRKVLGFIIGLAIALPTLVYSQNKNPSQIHLIDSMINVALGLESSNPDSAIVLYESIARLAEIEADWLRKGRTHNFRAIVYFEMGDYDMAAKHNEIALGYYEKAKHVIGIASVKINMGNLRLYFGDFNDAVKLYYEGIEIFKQEEDTLRLLTSYMNIGTLFYENDYLQEALNYYSNALEWAKTYGYPSLLTDLHYNIGNTLFRMNILDQYRKHLDSAIIYAEESHHIYGKLHIYNSLVRYYRHKGDEKDAMRYTSLAIESAEIYGNPFNLTETYNTAGSTYMMFNRTDEAYPLLLSAKNMSRNFNYKQLLSETLVHLADYFAVRNNYKQAYIYLNEHKQLADSLFTIEKQKELQELDRKYQIVKKESELKDQQLTIELKEREIDRKNRVITSSTAFIVFIVVTMFLTWKIQDKKKKLVNKELEMLKTEREKEVVKALLEGEEKERTRIARELHDGINGNLAALKLNMTSVQNPSYNQLIDETMEEIRNLSHNLMPEVVVKFGLREALDQYINHVGNGIDLKIDYQFVGKPDTISLEIAMHTYRIVQELVNNSLKHAEASEINVQLIVNDGILSIAVEDNGKGFEIGMAGKHPSNAGIGLSNVENRITFLQGNFDIHSSTDSGTGINIEIPLKTQTEI